MILDELCVAILSVTYGIPYLFEFGGIYDDMFFRNMWYLLIPLHMIVFAILAASTNYYERVIKDDNYANEHVHIVPITLALVCHGAGWSFLAQADPTRGLAIGAQMLLIFAHGFLQIAVKLRKPLYWLSAFGISFASLLVYFQRAMTSAHWRAVYRYFAGKGSVPLDTAALERNRMLPAAMLAADALLGVVILSGLLSKEPTAQRRVRSSSPPKSPELGTPKKPWWTILEVWEDNCSHASWWTGLRTIPCHHGYLRDRMTLEEAQRAALADGVSRCVCCSTDTNMYFSEYLILTAFASSVVLAATLAIADLELIVTTTFLRYTKIATYSFLWIPHFLYSCPVTDLNQRKRYLFAYWFTVASSGLTHHLAINHSLRAIPRWVSAFTDYIVLGLMPEALSDSVAQIGLRGGAHKKALVCVLVTVLCVIAGIHVAQEYLPNLQLTAMGVAFIGFSYPAAVILDRIDYLEPRGRQRQIRRGSSSSVTADWFAKRPGPPPSEESIPIGL